MARLSADRFFIDFIVKAQSSLVVIDKSTGARSGAENRTVMIRFYYDGGLGVDAADGYNVEWLGVTSGGQSRMFFGGEPRPNAHSFNPASPNPGLPQPGTAGSTIEIGRKLYWLGNFQVDVPSGQIEETTYHGELQLTIS